MSSEWGSIERADDFSPTRAVCEVVKDAIFVKDLDGRYLYVNPSGARFFGTTPESMIGTRDVDWFGPEVGRRLRDDDRAAIDTGGTSYEETMRLGDDSFVFATAKTPYRDASGNLVGIVGIARDVTERVAERRAIEAERDMYARMASVVPGAFFSLVTKRDGTFEVPYATPSVKELLGATPEELEAKPDWIRDRMHAGDRARVEAELGRSARDLTPLRCEYRILHPDRGEIWVEVAAGPVRQPDGGTLWHGIVLDVTARKRVERELREQKEMLEAIVATSPGAICSFQMAPDGTYSFPFVSDGMAQIYGTAPEHIERDASAALGRIHPEDMGLVQETIGRSAETMTSWRAEYRVNHPERGELWVEGQSKPTRQADGAILWHGILLDVTERKRVEAERRASESTLRAVVETVPNFLMLVARDRKILFINHVMPGFTKEDVVGKDVRMFLEPSIAERALEVFERVITDGTREAFETMGITPSGDYRWFDARLGPVVQDGAIVAAALALTDITERRRAEEKVRASEASLRSVLDTTPDLILSVDREMKIRFINRVMPHHTIEEVLGTDALARLSPGARDLAAAAIEKVIATGELESYEAELAVDGDPEIRWLSTRVGPLCEDGVVVGATLTGTDLTARRQMEKALRASEERYRMLVDFLPDAVFLNVGGKVAFCNPALVRLLGARSPDDVVGKTPFDIFHPDDHPQIRSRIARMQTIGGPAPPLEERLVAFDGTERRVIVIATPVTVDDAPAILVVLHDVTEKEKTERLLASVLESANDAIVTITADGTISTVNPATSRLFGRTEEELIGTNVRMLMPEPHRSAHDGYLRGFRKREGSSVVGREREVLALRKDGSTFPVELSVSGFLLNGRQHFTGVIRDMTERKRLEDQLRQAHKMEAFGQLAGGVAHDFNNLLTVIIGESELLSTMLGEDEEAVESLAAVNDAAQRAASLTRQLLAFSRKTVLEPKIVDVNAVVRETEKMLRRLIGEDIQLSTHLTPNTVRVNVDPGQLTQVLMNLAVNARDAMPKGGELEICTLPVVLEHGSSSDGLSPGRYVAISVRDSGTGMTEEVRRQVFQPFFTTKEVGKGTGLGLAVVHGIVNQSGGAVRVESEIGRGAKFEIILPAAQHARLDGEATAERQLRRGVETVLIVEDDEAVRRFALRVLAMSGYRVVVAPDGATAITILQTYEDPIDIVVTDVIMPTMDGAELGEALRDRFPSIKVLYVSGYTDDVLLKRGLQSQSVDFLAKPYTATALLHAIEHVLAKP